MYTYTEINALTSEGIQPSMLHTDDLTTNFFRRHLLQKAMSVFKWELPAGWNRTYWMYALYTLGKMAVFETPEYGVIPQHCTLTGQGLFYQPTHALVANPLLPDFNRLQIDTDCVLFKLQPDYGGVMDTVDYYASLCSMTTATFAMNMENSKLSYIFGAENKAAAESFKKLYDKIMSGEPAVAVDKKLFDDNGDPLWTPFSQNVGQNFIGNDLLTALNTLENKFSTAIGIPNANTEKKERLITDEVNANNTETYCDVSMWLEQLQESCKQVKTMFDIDMSVDWRFDPMATYGPASEEETE